MLYYRRWVRNKILIHNFNFYVISCQGGDPANAIMYLGQNGTVTGGPYKSDIGCQPYLIQPGKLPINLKGGKCQQKCQDSVMSYYGGKCIFEKFLLIP